MTRWFPLTALVSMLAAPFVHGQTPLDVGPGEQGATLKRPAAPPASPGGELQKLWTPLAAPNWNSGLAPGKKIALPPTQQADINRDIQVVPEAGTWLVLVTTYSGDDAPMKAREFVRITRDKYKINAYTYNYGADEKRKEYERAEAERQRQRELMRKEGLTPDLPIRVRVARIEEQTGVLVGGYRNRDDALKDLKNRLRKLDPTVLPRELLYMYYRGEASGDKQSKYPGAVITVNQQKKGAQGLDLHGTGIVHPFSTAFPVRNPMLPQEQTRDEVQDDMKFLRKVNENEPLTLLKCKKRYTLLIKQFRTTIMLNEDEKDKSFTTRFVKKLGEYDYAAQNAHNVADGFRKAGLPETYVLHARYCSYITVGSYDSVDDPALVQMQNHLEDRFRLESLRPLELLARPVPMEVPH